MSGLGFAPFFYIVAYFDAGKRENRVGALYYFRAAGAMTAFHELTLQKIREIERRTGKPARTLCVAVHLGKKERTMRWHLQKLERMGLIGRPWGNRSGWAVNGGRLAAA